jgi:hypothetical protein
MRSVPPAGPLLRAILELLKSGLNLHKRLVIDHQRPTFYPVACFESSADSIIPLVA